MYGGGGVDKEWIEEKIDDIVRSPWGRRAGQARVGIERRSVRHWLSWWTGAVCEAIRWCGSESQSASLTHFSMF